MSPAIATFAWVGGIWLVIFIGAVWVSHRNRQRPALPQRTPADVWADVAEHRARREAEQAADEDDFDISDAELADVLAIWSDDYRRKEGQQ